MLQLYQVMGPGFLYFNILLLSTSSIYIFSQTFVFYNTEEKGLDKDFSLNLFHILSIKYLIIMCLVQRPL